MVSCEVWMVIVDTFIVVYVHSCEMWIVRCGCVCLDMDEKRKCDVEFTIRAVI